MKGKRLGNKENFMKNVFKRFTGMVLVAALVVTSITVAKKPVTTYADNPAVQHLFAPDPAPMVYNDTVYLYTTHDEDETVGGFYTMNNWQCFSSKDMVNWTAHGTIASFTDFSWADTTDPRAWACQCIEKDGKFYLYVPLHKANGGVCIGVGVSDSPIGPFVDAIGKPLIEEGDWNDIDPTVYIDDDGQAYLYFGNPQLRYVLLNDDMLSYDKEVGIVKNEMTPEAFGEGSGDRSCSYAEGPWFYKRNNLYYMVYPAFGQTGGENISYSTSTSPTGPWTYGGVILSPNNCYTIHPGVIEYHGKNFLFYHGNPLDKTSSFHRSVSIEEFSYNDDGSISAMDQTHAGPDAVQNINPYERIEAETIAWERGVDIERNEDNTCQVYNIHDGNYIKVKNVDFGNKGPISVLANVLCKDSTAEGTIEFRIDCDEDIENEDLNGKKWSDEDFDLHNTDTDSGEVIATVDVKAGNADFTDIKGKIENKITGVHDLFIVFRSADGSTENELFKFDYWQFEKEPEPIQTPVTPPAPGTGDNSSQVSQPRPVEKEQLAKVKGLKVKKKGSKKAVVSWKKVTGAEKYELNYTTDRKFKKAVKKVVVKKTKVTVKLPKTGKICYFKVRAKSASMNTGKYSAVKKLKR